MKKKDRKSGIRRRLRRNRGRIALAAAAALLLAGILLIFTRCSGGGSEYDMEDEELPDTSEESFGVFLGIDKNNFSTDLFEGYDLVVVDAQELRSEQLAQLHAKGHRVFSYLNVGSIEKSRSYYKEYSGFCLDRYDNWPDEYWVDVTREEWKEFVTQELVDAITGKDPRIDGLFLDNLDIFAHVSETRKYRGMAADTYEALKEILRAYGNRELPVLVNGADVFVSALLEEGEEGLLMGVNQETVFSRIRDYDDDRFGVQKEEDRDYYLSYLETCRKAGLEVFLLEYTTDPDVEREILEYCDRKGYRCYISAHVDLNPLED